MEVYHAHITNLIHCYIPKLNGIYTYVNGFIKVLVELKQAWSSKLSCNNSRRYDSPFSRKWRLTLLFLVIFLIFPNWNCQFRSGLLEAGCDVISMYVLQSYRSCTFCKRETRGARQFWIELAAPYTLANNNEIIPTTHCQLSSSQHPSLEMTRVASGVNACCYRHVPYDLINKR